mmetsp:Transcript_97290/g.314173  ORF Transcript_97290/g.314173 Transcript_97290/m.314173 type:complete len:213 (-) Transcript_97290:362-1000(-)
MFAYGRGSGVVTIWFASSKEYCIVVRMLARPPTNLSLTPQGWLLLASFMLRQSTTRRRKMMATGCRTLQAVSTSNSSGQSGGGPWGPSSDSRPNCSNKCSSGSPAPGWWSLWMPTQPSMTLNSSSVRSWRRRSRSKSQYHFAWREMLPKQYPSWAMRVCSLKATPRATQSRTTSTRISWAFWSKPSSMKRDLGGMPGPPWKRKVAVLMPPRV